MVYALILSFKTLLRFSFRDGSHVFVWFWRNFNVVVLEIDTENRTGQRHKETKVSFTGILLHYFIAPVHVCVCVRAGTQAHTWNLHRCIHPCTPNTHSHTQSFLATISTRDACTSTIEGDFHLLLEVLCFPAHPSLILGPNMATELWWWKERICFLYFLFTLLADTNVFLVSWKFDECLSASLEGPGMARVPGEVVLSLSCPVHKALLTKQHYTLYMLSLKESWEAFLGLTP